MKIFSAKKSVYFANKVCKELEVVLNCSERKDFSDGEFMHSLCETVRGENVYLICSTFQPTDNLIELLMMADAAKRAGAKNIVAVLPYLTNSRSDKKDAPRTPIISSLVAKMIEVSGINQLVTMDLHNNAIEGFYNIPVSHIFSSAVIIPFIREKFYNKDLIIISPDVGGTKKAKIFSQALQTEMAICYKYREKANEIKEMKLIGNVKNKDCLIIDDIADTCGTLSECCNLLLNNGALSVRASVAHPVLSGKAFKNIGESKLEELIVTNSIPLSPFVFYPCHENPEMEKDSGYLGYRKITIVDVAPLFATVIHNIENKTSISANFLI